MNRYWITWAILVGLGASVFFGIVLLFYTTHHEFDKKCIAAGGTVDGINRGFWCYKNGVYIKP